LLLICCRYEREHSQSITGNGEGHCDKVLTEILVETEIGEIAAIITTRSVEEMKLKTGDKVFALVKATNVSIRHRK
jgi:molybdopterin-binding protein